MELSQTALAVMFVCAAPIGFVLGILYRLTDLDASRMGRATVLVLQNIKDFLFWIVAAVLTVLLVYYANDGQFRYLAPAGALLGFWVSSKLLAAPILAARRMALSVLGVVLGFAFRPLGWVWRITLGKMLARSKMKAAQKQTQRRAEWWAEQASVGFENKTFEHQTEDL